MQYGFHFNQNRCTGCFVCVVACRDWNDVPAGPASWMRIQTTEKGKYPEIFVANLPVTCFHCANPSCVPACPVAAIEKRDEDGIVLVDREACLGKDSCSLCFDACPHDAPQFGDEDNAKMQKCDLCAQRLSEGRKPTCVDSCPVHALDVGPMDELRAEYGDASEAEGFDYSGDLAPSIVFKPKNDARKLAVQRVEVRPKTG
jgi:anaerobic dimethyl sulfoxide reductase subunit B (iron-sulfur subunit)